MYSDSDLEQAVAAGVMSAQTAAAFRASVAAHRATPRVDEESFRLLTGFNDIFVTIAAVLMLVAVGWIGLSLGDALAHLVQNEPADAPISQYDNPFRNELGGGTAALLVAMASWGLAEYFTRLRRMALPSIVLLGSFAGGVGALVLSLWGVTAIGPGHGAVATFLQTGSCGLAVAVAAWCHWQRFHVPITIAVLAGAAVATVVALFAVLVPVLQSVMLLLVLIGGVAMFAFAMWWDISDRERVTRRADVAFWLHLAAAPMIAHPIFNMLGVVQGDITAAKAVLVLALYVLFGLVAIAVDRRALLVSSLVYVLYAMTSLVKAAGAIGLSFAVTGLVIGGALLILSALWQPIRRAVIERLPRDWQDRLPPVAAPLQLVRA